MAVDEVIWKGDDYFMIKGYHIEDGRKYASMVAMVSRPKAKKLEFELPRNSLHLRFLDSDPIGDMVFPAPIADGYQIVVKNNAVQRISVGGQLVYDRVKDGF